MSGAISITEALLRTMPLPRHADGEDKDQRGRVLVAGGSVEMPGGVLLAGLSALRAGAGKLQLATCRSVAPALAMAVPEARVIGLEETREGGIAVGAGDALARRCGRCDAVVIGPGMMESEAAAALTQAMLDGEAGAGFVLDAAALHGLQHDQDALARQAGRLVLTPHAGEMASMLGQTREAVLADPLGSARRAASSLQAVVVMKGSRTFIVTPQGQAWLCDRGQVGLATSGSGDTLAGVIGGLMARGAAPALAAVWGVFLHAEAGQALSRRHGPLGFLARELPAEIPRIMASLSGA